MRPKSPDGWNVATNPYRPSATTPPATQAHPRCSRRPCHTSHAPPISNTAARTNNPRERATVTASGPFIRWIGAAMRGRDGSLDRLCHAEHIGRQGGALRRGTYLEMQVRAVEEDAEVEERAASLLGRGKLGDRGESAGRNGEPATVGNLRTGCAIQDRCPLRNALGQALAS